jgi:hypothetical protein
MVVEGIECDDISQFLKFAVLQFLVFCRSFLKDPRGGDQSHLDVVVMWVCQNTLSLQLVHESLLHGGAFPAVVWHAQCFGLRPCL